MNRTLLRKIGNAIILAGLAAPLFAQLTATPQTPTTQDAVAQASTPQAAGTAVPTVEVRPGYTLGSGDIIGIRALEVEEISGKVYRIDNEGNVQLPLLGEMRAAGFTLEKFENALAERLKALVKNPQVMVTIAQYRNDPVFLTGGGFRSPGIFQLQGGRTLLDVLTVAGLQPNAARRLKISRRLEMGTIPLPNAQVDQEKQVSSVEISLAKLRESINPPENIFLKAYDTIDVDKAEAIYVSGEVNKIGALDMGDRDQLFLTQVVSLVGGLAKDAAPEKARILRPVLNTSQRAEIPVDLTKILAGKTSDFPLYPNDMLYVPRSAHKVAWSKLGLIALPMSTALIYVLVSKL